MPTKETAGPRPESIAPAAEGGRPLPSQLLTLEDVARVLKVSKAQAYRYLESGDLIPGIVLGSRRAAANGTESTVRRWHPEDLDNFLRGEPRGHEDGERT